MMITVFRLQEGLGLPDFDGYVMLFVFYLPFVHVFHIIWSDLAHCASLIPSCVHNVRRALVSEVTIICFGSETAFADLFTM